MTVRMTPQELERAGAGYGPVASRSSSIGADCYVDASYLDVEREYVFRRSWQYLCHERGLREPGSYVAASVAGRSIVAIRGEDGALRAFYNVCKHRGHELLSGAGTTRLITCPYHAWVYSLDGRLHRARRSELIENFDAGGIRLTPVRVEVFCHLVFVNLDPEAASLADQTEGLASEVTAYAPDLGALVFGHRLTYTLRANWKAVVDNFLECYHCPVAHRDFVSLVEMDTYEVATHGIWSSHMARAGRQRNSAYETGEAERHRPRGVVSLAEHHPDALSRPRELHGVALHPVGPEETYEEFRFLLRERSSHGAGNRGNPVHRRGAAARGHRSGRERAARHADPRVRTRPIPRGPRRLGTERARGPPFSRAGARRLRRACAA